MCLFDIDRENVNVFTLCHFTCNCYSVTYTYRHIQFAIESANLPACIEFLYFPSSYIIFQTVLKHHQHLQEASLSIHINFKAKIAINGNESFYCFSSFGLEISSEMYFLKQNLISILMIDAFIRYNRNSVLNFLKVCKYQSYKPTYHPIFFVRYQTNAGNMINNSYVNLNYVLSII